MLVIYLSLIYPSEKHLNNQNSIQYKQMKTVYLTKLGPYSTKPNN